MTYRSIVVAVSGGCLLAGFVLVAGCTKNERSSASHSAAQSAMQAASQLTTTSVTSVVAGQNPTQPKKTPGIKFNGRGGYDASVAQQAALRRAHWLRDHHNQIYRPSYPHPVTTQPTTQPTVTRTAGVLR